jgi:hypothetical protein
MRYLTDAYARKLGLRRPRVLEIAVRVLNEVEPMCSRRVVAAVVRKAADDVAMRYLPDAYARKLGLSRPRVLEIAVRVPSIFAFSHIIAKKHLMILPGLFLLSMELFVRVLQWGNFCAGGVSRFTGAGRRIRLLP